MDGVSVPVILKDWEYKYFKKHKDDFRKWLIAHENEDYNGKKLIDLEGMLNG